DSAILVFLYKPLLDLLLQPLRDPRIESFDEIPRHHRLVWSWHSSEQLTHRNRRATCVNCPRGEFLPIDLPALKWQRFHDDRRETVFAGCPGSSCDRYVSLAPKSGPLTDIAALQLCAKLGSRRVARRPRERG